jgi:hypothetical protein
MIAGGLVDDYILGGTGWAGEPDYIAGSRSHDFGFQEIFCHSCMFFIDWLFSIQPRSPVEMRHLVQKRFCGEQEGHSYARLAGNGVKTIYDYVVYAVPAYSLMG